MKLGTYFRLEEFIPKEVYNRFGENSIWFVDTRIVDLANFVRSRFGKSMTINNWHSGGNFNYRGFRPPDCSVGGKLSQHKFGRAIDFNIEGITPQEVYKDIIQNTSLYIKAGATTVEDIAYTKGWSHIDIRAHKEPGLKIVKP